MLKFFIFFYFLLLYFFFIIILYFYICTSIVNIMLYTIETFLYLNIMKLIMIMYVFMDVFMHVLESYELPLIR